MFAGEEGVGKHCCIVSGEMECFEIAIDHFVQGMIRDGNDHYFMIFNGRLILAVQCL